MTNQTFKEQQIDAAFDPKTEDDKAVVELFTAMSRIANEHKGDGRFRRSIALLGGLTLGLAMEETSSFDAQFVKDKVVALTKEFFDSFRTGGDGDGEADNQS